MRQGQDKLVEGRRREREHQEEAQPARRSGEPGPRPPLATSPLEAGGLSGRRLTAVSKARSDRPTIIAIPFAFAIS